MAFDKSGIAIPIDLDISTTNKTVTVPAKQYDKTSKFLEVSLYENGSVYNVPVGTTATLGGTKPSSHIFIDAVTIEDNKLYVYLTEQACAISGYFDVEFTLYVNGNTIGIPCFKFYVEKAAVPAGAVVDNDEVGILNQLITDSASAINGANNATSNANSAINTINATNQTVSDAEVIRVTDENTRVTNEQNRVANDLTRPIYLYKTQAEYDALPQEDKDNPKYMYEITDDDGEFPTNLQTLINDVSTAKNNYDSAVASSSNVEVVDARTSSVTGTTSPNLKGRLDSVDGQLATIAIEKAEKTTTDNIQNQINVITTQSDNYYVKCLQTDTGASLVVASGATTGQINLADVKHMSDYSPIVGDYVTKIYNTVNAETKDIRSGADGKVYASAGEAVRGQAGNLTKNIVNHNRSLYDTDLLISDFKSGSFDSSAGIIIDYPSRVSSKLLIFAKQTTITPESGYTILAYSYNGSVYTNITPNWNSNPQSVTFNAGSSGVIVVAKFPVSSSSTLAVDEAYAAITRYKYNYPIMLFNNNDFKNYYIALGAYLYKGAIYADGTFHAEVPYRVSTYNLITAKNGHTLIAKSGFRFMVYINTNGTWTSSGFTTYYVIPKDTQYKVVIARTTENTSENADVNEFCNGIELHNVCINTLSTSRLFGKKMNIIGDSYVAGIDIGVSKTWSYYIAQKWGMTYRNYGISGNAITTTKDGVTTGIPMMDRYVDMDNDADYILVVGGKNDYNCQILIDEFKTKFTQFIEGLCNKYIGKKIGFFTPWRISLNNVEDLFGSVASIPLIEYINAIEEICELHAIPCFNSAKDSNILMWNANFRSQYCMTASDISHLNENGQKLFVDKAEAFIESL